MTDELKTLKDLNCDACDRDGHMKLLNFPCPVSVDTMELKQEAIKWIYMLELNKKEFILDRRKDNKDIYLINWIKHFFNLTEEDNDRKIYLHE